MTNDSNVPVASVPAQVETDKLKAKFMARSIPLQQDFHDLIDMADAGRLAAGLSPAQDGRKIQRKPASLSAMINDLPLRQKQMAGWMLQPTACQLRRETVLTPVCMG